MSTIEFECISKTNDQICISGFVEYDEIDDDECIQYYDNNGFENGYNIPSNPYPENRQYDWHVDWDILKNNMCTDDLFLQCLAECYNKCATIDRGDYILKVYGYGDE